MGTQRCEWRVVSLASCTRRLRAESQKRVRGGAESSTPDFGAASLITTTPDQCGSGH